MSTLALSFLNGSSLILAGKKDNHKSFDEFEFLPDLITNY